MRKRRIMNGWKLGNITVLRARADGKRSVETRKRSVLLSVRTYNLDD